MELKFSYDTNFINFDHHKPRYWVQRTAIPYIPDITSWTSRTLVCTVIGVNQLQFEPSKNIKSGKMTRNKNNPPPPLPLKKQTNKQTKKKKKKKKANSIGNLCPPPYFYLSC